MTADDGNEQPAEAVATRPRYHSITAEMLNGVDFERAIDGAAAADCREYQDLFSKAAEARRGIWKRHRDRHRKRLPIPTRADDQA